MHVQWKERTCVCTIGKGKVHVYTEKEGHGVYTEGKGARCCSSLFPPPTQPRPTLFKDCLTLQEASTSNPDRNLTLYMGEGIEQKLLLCKVWEKNPCYPLSSLILLLLYPSKMELYKGQCLELHNNPPCCSEESEDNPREQQRRQDSHPCGSQPGPRPQPRSCMEYILKGIKGLES